MIQKQKQQFLAGEGDAYFARNQSVLTLADAIANTDPVLPVLAGIKPFPKRVLEIGCANGWRLNQIRAFGAEHCQGIDPSHDAVECGKRAYSAIDLRVGTADLLPFPNASFDLLVFGFCLYLCDPDDHFRIVCEADRVLANEGHLVIFDFDPPAPYRNVYAHLQDVFSYKMDFSRLFLAHPHYLLREKRVGPHGCTGLVGPDDRVAVTWLAKTVASAWPISPWQHE